MAQMSITIEPFRKGNSFTEWAERLDYFFIVNKVPEADKKAHFIALSGPSVYTELKLVFPNGLLNTATYNEVISKLKARFDKIDSDLIQRLKFNGRIQQPNESLEDFVLALKLQAEFCSFGTFKESAIVDRIISGVRDVELRKKLINENMPTLEATERFLATWEMADNNAKNFRCKRGAGSGKDSFT